VGPFDHDRARNKTNRFSYFHASIQTRPTDIFRALLARCTQHMLLDRRSKRACLNCKLGTCFLGAFGRLVSGSLAQSLVCRVSITVQERATFQFWEHPILRLPDIEVKRLSVLCLLWLHFQILSQAVRNRTVSGLSAHTQADKEKIRIRAALLRHLLQEASVRRADLSSITRRHENRQNWRWWEGKDRRRERRRPQARSTRSKWYFTAKNSASRSSRCMPWEKDRVFGRQVLIGRDMLVGGGGVGLARTKALTHVRGLLG